MRQPASTLEAFYASQLGQSAADLIAQRIVDIWGTCQGEHVLGVGYPHPLLGVWQDSASTCVGVSPDDMGPAVYLTDRGNTITLSPEGRLPFRDGVFTRLVLLHCIEEAESPKQVFREAWRVLAPEGKIIVATTNRRSFWSITDSTAFGYGRPWTRRQLMNFMNDSLFQVTASTTAVHMPPLNWSIITSASRTWERAGGLFTPGLGGVVLVEAVKRLYANPRGSAPATASNPVRKGAARPVLPRKTEFD